MRCSPPDRRPVTQRYAWHVADRLDVAAMVDAFRRVEGCHDFSAFQVAGSDVRDTIRTVSAARATVRSLDWCGTQAGRAFVLAFELTGDGFLRHMVRSIIGTVVEVGRGAGSRRASMVCSRALHAAKLGRPLRRKACAAAGDLLAACCSMPLTPGIIGSYVLELNGPD